MPAVVRGRVGARAERLTLADAERGCGIGVRVAAQHRVIARGIFITHGCVIGAIGNLARDPSASTGTTPPSSPVSGPICTRGVLGHVRRFTCRAGQTSIQLATAVCFFCPRRRRRDISRRKRDAHRGRDQRARTLQIWPAGARHRGGPLLRGCAERRHKVMRLIGLQATIAGTASSESRFSPVAGRRRDPATRQ